MKKWIAIAVVFLLAAPMFAFAQEKTAKINKKNLVIKEWNTNSKGTSSILDHETTFNADGRKIEEKEFDNDGKNRLQNYKTFEFNEFGRKKLQYTYDAKGKLIAIKKFEYIAQEAD